MAEYSSTTECITEKKESPKQHRAPCLHATLRSIWIAAVCVLCSNKSHIASAQVGQVPPSSKKHNAAEHEKDMSLHQKWLQKEFPKCKLIIEKHMEAMDSRTYSIREKGSEDFDACLRHLKQTINPLPEEVKDFVITKRKFSSLEQKMRTLKVWEKWKRSQESITRLPIDPDNALKTLKGLAHHIGITIEVPKELHPLLAKIKLDPTQNTFCEILAQITEKADIYPRVAQDKHFTFVLEKDDKNRRCTIDPTGVMMGSMDAAAQREQSKRTNECQFNSRSRQCSDYSGAKDMHSVRTGSV